MKRIIGILLAICLTLLTCAACVSDNGVASGEGQKIAYVLTETGDTYSQGLGANFKTAFEGLGGRVIEEQFPKGTSNFSDYLQKAIDNKADVIFAPNSTVVAANLIKQAKTAGIKCPILAGDTWEHSDILNAQKGTGLDVYCSTFFAEEDKSDAAAEFVSGFKAWLNANDSQKAMNGGNDIVAAVSALGFDSYNVAYAAIEAAAKEKGEELTSIDVAKAIWELSYDEAVTGSVKFDVNGDAIKSTAYIKKANEGAFEFVKTQSVENNAEQAKAFDYSSYKNCNALDKVNHVIKIGVYEPQSGDNANGGKQEVLGARYANSLKPEIEIAGVKYTIELVEADNCSSDDKAASAASTIVSSGALVALGSYGSGVSIAANSTFENAGVPAIGCSCTNSAVTVDHPFYFRICFLDPFQGSVMAGFAMSLIK